VRGSEHSHAEHDGRRRGHCRVRRADLPLTIDRVRVSNVRVAVADFLDGLAQVTGVPIDGIVGTNVLRRFRVVIDYPGKVLRLD